MDYSKKETPEGYVCCKCGAQNVKLWRLYQTFLEHQELTCAFCSGKLEDKDVSTIGSDGLYYSDFGKTDQIGWRIPAIPTEDGESYWGYSSVPLNGVDWWKNLESKPVKYLRKQKLDELKDR